MYRTRHQAPAIQWDAAIAKQAAAFASGCPQGHSGTRGVGENMAWGYADFVKAIDAWYNEVGGRLRPMHHGPLRLYVHSWNVVCNKHNRLPLAHEILKIAD